MTRDGKVRAALWLPAGLSGLVLAAVVGVVAAEALPAISGLGLGRFLGDADWFPTSGQFNLRPMLAGTGLSALGAIALATLFGVGSAIACCFYLPRPLAALFLRLVELAAAVPSVVYGLWGLVVLVPAIARLAPPGASLLAAILVLAVMVTPTVTVLATGSLRAVAPELYAGARALGFSKPTAVLRVVVPAAAPGLAGAIILGAARAVGETMAVLMVAGNLPRLPGSLFDPIRTLSANIALEIGYAMGEHRAALFLSGLMLIAVIALCVLAAHLIAARHHHA